ncbi:hypothetical protein [Citrobacter koseri]|uniref:hypothetical protein n=1 Tax=Citrobacter koseri TaxID=545 RepID=UPI001903FAB1|nr:hypothetical protein [Citrobacter koseri]MBJ9246416.1 hypothetical protein [Citrobacter koseri]
MSENNYGSLMLKSALATSTDLKKVTAPGMYPVIQGNSTAPDSSAGLLTVSFTPIKQKVTFQKESSSVVYSLIDGDWIKPTYSDVGAMPVEVNGVIRDGATMAAANKGGWWRVVVTNPAAMSDFPARPNGTKLYGYGYMFVMLSENSWLQHYYSHRGEVAIRQEWTTGPTTDVEWNIDYNPANKPTAGDVGALPVSGGEVLGAVTVKRNNAALTIQNTSPNSSLYLLGVNEKGENLFYVGRGGSSNTIVLSNYNGNNAVNLNEDGSVSITSPAGKNVTTNRQFVPSDYGNFDTRYQAKGNYTPAGEAYTKAASDARYVQNIRVSATQTRTFSDGGGFSSNDAAFATAIQMVGGSSNVGSLLVRYVQKNINGTWVNITT